MIKKFIDFIKENVDYKFKNDSEEYRYKKVLDEINNAKIGDIISESTIYMYIEYLTIKAENSWKYEESFVDGDLAERIEEYSKYILQEIPISDIDIDEFEMDEDDVNIYKDKYLSTKEYPPIVIGKSQFTNHGVYYIIDGTHRANALKNAGVEKILAFVGMK